MYTIGEFSAITGITKKTLRYYDEINLLKPSDKNVQNSYRMYDEKNIDKAEEIVQFKNFGLSLAEIRSLIEQSERSNLENILNFRITAIEQEIKALKEQQKHIRRYRNNKDVPSFHNEKLAINECVFKGGNSVYLDFTDENCNYHSAIDQFYKYVSKNNCELISNHYFKKSIKEDEQENLRIFAFVQKTDHKLNTQEIKNSKTLSVYSNDLNSKNNAYKQLINHAKSIDVNIIEFVEEYNMRKGNLSITIYGLID